MKAPWGQCPAFLHCPAAPLLSEPHIPFFIPSPGLLSRAPDVSPSAEHTEFPSVFLL